MATQTLPGIPSMAPLFAKAVLTARGRTGDSLPERTLRVEDVRVDQHTLGAFQRLTGFDYSSTLPQTYPWVLAFPVQTALMSEPDFPVPLPGLVHLSNAVTTHARMDAADPLTLEVTATSLQPHPRGRTLGVHLEAFVGGDLVWECDSRYLARGPGEESASRGEAPPDLPAGDPVAVWRLPESLGRDYAAVSGDINPIHLHPLTAKAMGFRRHIAHGMWSYSRILAALGPGSLGPSGSRVWFTQPIFLPGTVELVRARTDDGLLAGLRSGSDHERAYAVVTVGIRR